MRVRHLISHRCPEKPDCTDSLLRLFGCWHAVPRVVREALVSWDHASDYPLPKSKDWTSAGGAAGFTKTYKLGGEHAFLADHVVDGRILMPVRSSMPMKSPLS